MVEIFYNYMNITKICLHNQQIFKKYFQENVDLDITDKKVLKNDINKILWVYNLKPETININGYVDNTVEYKEIQIIKIDVNSINNVKRIVNFLNKAIPYPLVIVFCFNSTIAIAVAHKRINKADTSKFVVEDILLTQWFNPSTPTQAQQQFMQDMALKNLSFVNLYAFYTDIINRVVALNCASKTGNYTVVFAQQTQNRIKHLKKIEELEAECKQLSYKIKNETQFNKKVNFNAIINSKKDDIKKLQQDL